MHFDRCSRHSEVMNSSGKWSHLPAVLRPCLYSWNEQRVSSVTRALLDVLPGSARARSSGGSSDHPTFSLGVVINSLAWPNTWLYDLVAPATRVIYPPAAAFCRARLSWALDLTAPGGVAGALVEPGVAGALDVPASARAGTALWAMSACHWARNVSIWRSFTGPPARLLRSDAQCLPVSLVFIGFWP